MLNQLLINEILHLRIYLQFITTIHFTSKVGFFSANSKDSQPPKNTYFSAVATRGHEPDAERQNVLTAPNPKWQKTIQPHGAAVNHLAPPNQRRGRPLGHHRAPRPPARTTGAYVVSPGRARGPRGEPVTVSRAG